MNEVEVRGFIKSKEEFNNLIKKFSSEYDYKKVHRLSIVSGDYQTRSIETRLRVTDGNITLAQKKGDLGAITREEIETVLDIDKESFYKIGKIINNDSELFPDHYCIVIQHENHLFSNKDLEIKLFKQFGKSEFFGYEVESSSHSESELLELTKDLGLDITPHYDDDEIIRKRNTEVNFPFLELSERELKEIISKYF